MLIVALNYCTYIFCFLWYRQWAENASFSIIVDRVFSEFSSSGREEVFYFLLFGTTVRAFSSPWQINKSCLGSMKTLFTNPWKVLSRTNDNLILILDRSYPVSMTGKSCIDSMTSLVSNHNKSFVESVTSLFSSPWKVLPWIKRRVLFRVKGQALSRIHVKSCLLYVHVKSRVESATVLVISQWQRNAFSWR